MIDKSLIQINFLILVIQIYGKIKRLTQRYLKILEKIIY